MSRIRTQVELPTFVRIKPGALSRIGLYASRHGHRRIGLIVSQGILPQLLDPVVAGLRDAGAEVIDRVEVDQASFEVATARLSQVGHRSGSAWQAVVGLGGGRAIDVAKYVAFLSGLPFYAVPTSLSNDGFCSPQASLTLAEERRSFPAALPFAVVVDTDACSHAPDPLWWSGVGDLVAKLTAAQDWKLAYHQAGEPVDDFSLLLSTATVYQFFARPSRDLVGTRLLATALMLNGIAMAISGSSRPASGAEHLISHALDERSVRPRLHGLQVGVAAYLVSQLQGVVTAQIAQVFDQTGFWSGIRADPFSREEWLDAIRRAPAIKPDRFTILSTRDCLDELARIMTTDSRLQGCFL